MTHFSAGDVIRIVDDIAEVHNLQENHGGWVDDMALVSNVCFGLLPGSDNNHDLSKAELCKKQRKQVWDFKTCHDVCYVVLNKNGQCVGADDTGPIYMSTRGIHRGRMFIHCTLPLSFH